MLPVATVDCALIGALVNRRMKEISDTKLPHFFIASPSKQIALESSPEVLSGQPTADPCCPLLGFPSPFNDLTCNSRATANYIVITAKSSISIEFTAPATFYNSVL